MESFAVNLGQGVGGKVTLRSVYAQFLDTRNFDGGKNAQADPTQEAVSYYIIE